MSTTTTTTTEQTETTIVDRVEAYLNKYMVFSTPDQARIIALWILHTHTFSESFPRGPWTTPYLYVNSIEPQCGKTLLIDLLEPVVLNPERTIDMTSSVMFRLIEHIRPTLFIDEVDTVWSGAKQEGLRNVINGGYERGGYVWRNAPGKDGPEPTKFRTFSAKLLAGIDNGHLPDTVATRSIFINLERVASLNDEGELVAPDGTTRPVYYKFLAGPEAEQMVREITAFMAEWAADYKEYMPKPIKGMNPRHWEIVFPLVQIAARVGIEDEVREALVRIFSTKRVAETEETKLVRGIRDAFDKEETDRLHTADIVKHLGDGWNGKLLQNRLRGIVTGTSTNLTIGNRNLKGYYRHQFTEAISRYL